MGGLLADDGRSKAFLCGRITDPGQYAQLMIRCANFHLIAMLLPGAYNYTLIERARGQQRSVVWCATYTHSSSIYNSPVVLGAPNEHTQGWDL